MAHWDMVSILLPAGGRRNRAADYCSPLCYAVHREAGPVDLVRRGVVQCLMRSERVVVINVAADRRAQLFWATVLIDIDQFRLEAAEPALDHDVVCPAGFAVHALANSQTLEQPLVFFTGKLAALVRIQDGGHAAMLDRALDSFQYRPRIQRVGQSPADDLAAEPVDDGMSMDQT